MFATSLALLASAYQGADRGTAIGIWGATIGGAVAVGPLVGGVLTEWIGWQAIFYVNVPIGIYAIALTLRRVGESHDPQAGGADWIGTVTFSAALFLLVFGLIRGNAEDWNAQIVACLVGAVVLLIAFVVAEMRVPAPMFDLRLFRKPSFSGASIAAFVLSASMFAMFLYLTLWVQNMPRLLGARGRPALPADHARVVRGRAGVGQAVRAVRRALVPQRRAACSSASACC